MTHFKGATQPEGKTEVNAKTKKTKANAKGPVRLVAGLGRGSLPGVS